MFLTVNRIKWELSLQAVFFVHLGKDKALASAIYKLKLSRESDVTMAIINT
jgi:hypothetical protein